MSDRLAALGAAARDHHLAIFGVAPIRPEDGLQTEGALVLLGPLEPGFWPHVTAAPEFGDGAPDPLDRWSARVIGALARDHGATALFPFGDPVRPFVTWAMRSGRAWQSPVTLLVHDRAGLMVSYRGALAVPDLVAPAPDVERPCDTCAGRPCLDACPPRALTGEGYDLDRCHGFLDTAAGAACLSGGCLVRRACPVSARYARLPEQSAWHMRRFHP